MESEPKCTGTAGSGIKEHEITVLLVDDQAMIGEAVRRMLASEEGIRFHYLGDPSRAVTMANEIRPTVILQDLVMPDVDGLTLVKFYRANPATRDTPLIVLSTKEEPTTKAEAFALGANDYLVKLPDKIELVARIRYHSRGYINLLQRNEVYEALLASQKALAAELAEAAAYVQSLLPPPMTEGQIRTEWRFIPSTQLGGDAFGYHQIDGDHFCMYLLDVCGHGVGAALLSISAMNVLRSQSLPKTDFTDPGATLSALNEAFLMEKQNNMYFTIWYGVYQHSTRRLTFSSAGHPPALLFTVDAAGKASAQELRTTGPVLGAISEMVYKTGSCVVPVGATLFVMSDGTYEITRPDSTLWTFEEFTELLAKATEVGKPQIEELSRSVNEIQGGGPLDDDFSILKVSLG
ncbi:MAG: SpoIIE family protein phosphatase [Candidatus Riflebacteria bacterium]|nr:SpoIIE family protein phosphatase [Candidatus Riflebacteria bacterium]